MEKVTLYDIIQKRCLYISKLHQYIEWRGQKVDRGDLTNMLQEKKTMKPEVKTIVEEWIMNPVNIAYKTKPE